MTSFESLSLTFRFPSDHYRREAWFEQLAIHIDDFDQGSTIYTSYVIANGYINYTKVLMRYLKI